jgi:cyclic-di-AMP phosphodiesterase PgpH
MIKATAGLLERYFNIDEEQAVTSLNRLVVTLAAAFFLLTTTLLVAFESFFPGQDNAEALQVGRVAQQAIYAPETITYTSDVLTAQRREQAASGINPIFDSPDPSVARQQTDLARQILTYIANVRLDPYATEEQQINDIQQIIALELQNETITHVLKVSDARWQEIDTEIISILERVMRGEIKSSDLSRIRSLLPTQVGVRFDDERDITLIVAIISDLLRPNTSENVEATALARQQAIDNIPPETRSFEAGQIVVAEGTRISNADYEALGQLGLLESEERQTQDIIRALLASIIVMVFIGLYVARFRPSLMHSEPRLLFLVAGLFLILLTGARFTPDESIYIYPTAALGLLIVILVSSEIAVVAILGIGFLIAMMYGATLEIFALVFIGGLIGVLTLRHAERFNSFFFAGLMIAISNIAIVALFNLTPTEVNQNSDITLLMLLAALNGMLSALVAIGGLYIITLLFNLPTSLKLTELSQPSQPLLQRLLREAPGTYTHSLHVANLAEQATNAIGANSELTRVAALYHDIGKISNPIFFTENQADHSNPHDTLSDPYRSADIIISHVTDGDEMARQYRLPARLRDFIREHHGTSQVYVFYKQALILAGEDEGNIDITDFTYPGPKPQSRETAVLMLADSCEAAVKSRQPKNKDEIEETVHSVIDGKHRAGELDDSGLTLNDIKRTQNIFIDILQAMYHPRINYSEAISRVSTQVNELPPAPEATRKANNAEPSEPVKKRTGDTKPIPTTEAKSEDKDADVTPLAEVPRLKKADDKANNEQNENSETV